MDNPMVEEWREIDGYPNYQVSNMGRVKTRCCPGYHGLTIDWHPLNHWIANNGYPTVSVTRNRVRRTVCVHTLVLEAFVGPRPPKLVACHENGISVDVRLANLRWDTYKANEADKVRHGTHNRGERSGLAKLTNDQVREIMILLDENRVKQRVIARTYGVSDQTICDIKKGRKYASVTGYRQAKIAACSPPA